MCSPSLTLAATAGLQSLQNYISLHSEYISVMTCFMSGYKTVEIAQSKRPQWFLLYYSGGPENASSGNPDKIFSCSFLSRRTYICIYFLFFISSAWIHRLLAPALYLFFVVFFVAQTSGRSPRFAFASTPPSLPAGGARVTAAMSNPPRLEGYAASRASGKPPLKLLMTTSCKGGESARLQAKKSRQPSKWATSDTATGLLMSEEGSLVMSLVASKEGPSWGTVSAGWPNEATMKRKSWVRRWPVTAAPRKTLVATLEELLMLEPRRGLSQHSRARKHL